MKKIFLFFFILIEIFNTYPIKFKLPNKNDTIQKTIIQTIFDTGFGILGVSDGIGVTDYQSYFFKTALHINNFGIGFDLTIRFRIFSHQPEFRTKDWFIENDGLRTLFLYLDKIDYIKYGNEDHLINFTTGTIPYISFGTGFLVNNFHNKFFLPNEKENGLLFQFDGNNIDKIKKIPFLITFFCPDLLDPDIFGLDVNFNLMELTPYKNIFGLNVGSSFMTDFDSIENNRLSAIVKDNFQSHRNFSINGYSSSIFANSHYFKLSFLKKNLFKIFVYDEFAYLLNLPNKDNPNRFKFGLGNNFEIDSRFVNVRDSGFLLGINIGLLLQGYDYYINYFSSNYQIVRQKQYLGQVDDHRVFLTLGFGIFAFQEKLHFKVKLSMPLTSSVFFAKFAMEFRLLDFVVKGLYIDAFYESGVNDIRIEGSNGGYFLESITRNFRFFSEIGYKIYSAKMHFLIGIQTPGWISKEDYYQVDNPTDLNIDKYGRDIQKFVGVGVSFVL